MNKKNYIYSAFILADGENEKDGENNALMKINNYLIEIIKLEEYKSKYGN